MKQLINGSSVDVNQLIPLKYPWAREHYLNGCSNNWLPSEVPMGKDIETWRGKGALSEAERKIIKKTLGFFSTAESLVGNNIVLAIFKHITNAECRQYLLRQAFEEAVHTDCFMYIVESLGLDCVEIFEMYQSDYTIKAKDEFQMQITSEILDPNFSTASYDGIRKLLRNLIGYYVAMEGIFFYSGFASILSLHRRNLMTGIGQQFQYIIRDETIHLNFGIDLINGIKAENPLVWTKPFQENIIAMIEEAVDLEISYAKHSQSSNLPSLALTDVADYICHIADRRLARIGLPEIYHKVNPFPWMSETIDLPKEKNFFETRVTEYSMKPLEW